MPTLILTPEELRWGAYVAVCRQMDNELKGRKDGNHFSGDGYEAHVVGLQGEMVWLKYNDEWPGQLWEFDAPDSHDYEIKCTKGVRLHVQGDRNNPDHPIHRKRKHLLICRSRPDPKIGYRFLLAGWIEAADIPIRGTWGEPQKGRPCWIVEQKDLEPFPEERA